MQPLVPFHFDLPKYSHKRMNYGPPKCESYEKAIETDDLRQKKSTTNYSKWHHFFVGMAEDALF